MIAIIDNELEMVTDDAAFTLMDSDGNTYSFQLTEAQLLQTEGHTQGSVPEDVPAGDLNGGKGKSA
ncbi:MAG: hypothetical protein OXE42_20495, partial [Gammaproteobacteria bacterium]|nr:hypothetical protein [Gammaproteobacteria bacterium]